MPSLLRHASVSLVFVLPTCRYVLRRDPLPLSIFLPLADLHRNTLHRACGLRSPCHTGVWEKTDRRTGLQETVYATAIPVHHSRRRRVADLRELLFHLLADIQLCKASQMWGVRRCTQMESRLARSTARLELYPLPFLRFLHFRRSIKQADETFSLRYYALHTTVF